MASLADQEKYARKIQRIWRSHRLVEQSRLRILSMIWNSLNDDEERCTQEEESVVEILRPEFEKQKQILQSDSPDQKRMRTLKSGSTASLPQDPLAVGSPSVSLFPLEVP